MEQYWMPKKLDFKNLRFCLDNYPQDWLYIRLVGSRAASLGVDAFKIGESLEDKKLDFKKDKTGLYFLIDNIEVFHFSLEDYDNDRDIKGFSLAYERFFPTDNGIGRMFIPDRGVDPYDSTLPEPKRSFLRNVIDHHLLEIYFKGRIPIKFHSWWQKPHFKFWTIDKS